MLDGAGLVRRVRYVIWPGVSDMTLLVAIVSLIAFTASGFDLVNILTKGQPIYGTETLIYYIYTRRSSARSGVTRRRSQFSSSRSSSGSWLCSPSRVSSWRVGHESLRRTVQSDQDLLRHAHRAGARRTAALPGRGSLMSSAQVDAATPQFIPSSLHFDDYVNGWNLVLRRSPDLPQLADLRRLRGRASVGVVHQRRTRDREDALPGTHR